MRKTCLGELNKGNNDVKIQNHPLSPKKYLDVDKDLKYPYKFLVKCTFPKKTLP